MNIFILSKINRLKEDKYIVAQATMGMTKTVVVVFKWHENKKYCTTLLLILE